MTLQEAVIKVPTLSTLNLCTPLSMNCELILHMSTSHPLHKQKAICTSLKSTQCTAVLIVMFVEQPLN